MGDAHGERELGDQAVEAARKTRVAEPYVPDAATQTSRSKVPPTGGLFS
jgi:hypothetical protein